MIKLIQVETIEQPGSYYRVDQVNEALIEQWNLGFAEGKQSLDQPTQAAEYKEFLADLKRIIVKDSNVNTLDIRPESCKWAGSRLWLKRLWFWLEGPQTFSDSWWQSQHRRDHCKGYEGVCWKWPIEDGLSKTNSPH